MKIFVYFLATVCACNATFSNLFKEEAAGGSNKIAGPSDSYSHHPSTYNNNHRYGGGPPQVIKIIILREGGDVKGNAGAYSHASGHNYGGQAQIFKVIEHNSALGSYGKSSGPTYNPGHSNGGASSYYNTQLHDILPQIIQLIFQGDAKFGLNSQLVAAYGNSGIQASIKPSDGKNKHFYSSGHVVQRGVIKIVKEDETPAQSSYGSAAHGPAQYAHGC